MNILKHNNHPIIVPENWMIVEDPTSVFHDIKLYHHDRLMKTFHDIPDVKDDIDRFIKEYRYGT